MPSDAHDTGDPGPPERSGLSGAATPGEVSPLTAANVRSAALNSPCSTTPLPTPMTRATTTMTPSARAAGAAIPRPSRRDSARVARRSSRAAPTSAANNSAASSTTST
nr:hypothetical protein [Planobispora takensis]